MRFYESCVSCFSTDSFPMGSRRHHYEGDAYRNAHYHDGRLGYTMIFS
jgi:hypothetical protein